MQWKVSPSFPAYEVSESGAVRRIATGKCRKACLNSAGYPAYRLRRAGATVNATAHALVAEAFLGPKPFDGAEICHNDGDKGNSHDSNLRWDTHKANMGDDDFRGEENSQAKLTEAEVIEIRSRVALGERQRTMSREFGVVPSVICDIVNRRLWAHVA